LIISSIADFPKGWIIGDFSPSLFVNKNVEVSVKYFRSGDLEPSHKQLIATEITVVVSGKIRMKDLILSEGQIVTIPPGEFADFEALTDCSLVCIKYPSIPSDKVLENE
jgi:hypothetical protein